MPELNFKKSHYSQLAPLASLVHAKNVARGGMRA